ncbi:hypothetical protein BIW11_03507 [Tropilaelaps mercedesae]|uniref:Uncharacterized protein n=1 Tax=Tropilaelaps mercedesae TaxID=418985 RepID=A0A1V9XJW5_9ACAR|nr:hypothetical protein BIW11_03507 [Tropilaelaps mercedesae]
MLQEANVGADVEPQISRIRATADRKDNTDEQNVPKTYSGKDKIMMNAIVLALAALVACTYAGDHGWETPVVSHAKIAKVSYVKEPVVSVKYVKEPVVSYKLRPVKSISYVSKPVVSYHSAPVLSYHKAPTSYSSGWAPSYSSGWW